MLALAPGPAAPRLQRARGRARLAVERRGGRDALADLDQAGSGRFLLPRVPRDAPLQAVLVNTAGGLAGGDRFEAGASLGMGARAVVTTQAAERVYRAAGLEPARVATRLRVGAGASLAWVPQETILFDGARLSRGLDAEVAGTGTLLLAEALVLGRRARGERLASGAIEDRWRIRRDGRLAFAESLRIAGAIADLTTRPALFGIAGAAATVLLVAPDAETRLAAARAALDAPGCEAGASAFDGLLAARCLARDGAAVRGWLLGLLPALAGVGLPRIWTN